MASSAGFPFLAFSLEGEVDHHDGVFLHNTDEQDDADQGNDTEFHLRNHQREQGADAGRRQGRNDGDGMDIALVKHTEHDVDSDQCREDQQRLVGQRSLKCGGGALEAGVDAGGHADALLHGIDGLNGVTQCFAGREVEADDRSKGTGPRGRWRVAPLICSQ